MTTMTQSTTLMRWWFLLVAVWSGLLVAGCAARSADLDTLRQFHQDVQAEAVEQDGGGDANAIARWSDGWLRALNAGRLAANWREAMRDSWLKGDEPDLPYDENYSVRAYTLYTSALMNWVPIIDRILGVDPNVVK